MFMFIYFTNINMAEESRKKIDTHFSSNETEILIEKFQNEPDLWDISNPNYSKKDARSRALQRIKEALDDKFTVDEINTRLKHMRSYYTRELAKVKASVKSGASTDEIYKSKWAYFDTLNAFLRSQITPRKSMTNLDSQEISLEECEDDDSLSEASVSGRQTPIPVPKKRKQSGTVAVIAEAVSVLQEMRSQKKKPEEKEVEDDDIIFARYLASELKKINDPRVKNMTKLKLQSIIFDAQLPRQPLPHAAAYNYPRQNYMQMPPMSSAGYGEQGCSTETPYAKDY